MDSHKYDSADQEQRNLTISFVVTGFWVIALLSIIVALSSYFVVRCYNLQSSAYANYQTLSKTLYPKLSADVLSLPTEDLKPIAKAFQSTLREDAFVLIDNRGKRVWTSAKSQPVDLSDIKPSVLSFIPLSRFQANDIRTIDQNLLNINTWLNVIKGDYPRLTQQLKIEDRSGQKIGFVRLAVEVNEALRSALLFSIVLFLTTLIFGFLLFYRLYKSFKKVLSTIEAQEETLNDNVRNLSSLLKANQQMQSNIRTASARAVELNEQFLRRVGADLHDGPAQMIGYANMRLHKVAQLDVAKELGHEFHGVRQSLEEALDEIRGISSGLVLPELESMTLEECMRKVIIIHSVQSNAQVTQDYTDMPEGVPLPIKICAYRFVQEGLNNAEQHGKAEKCRLNVRCTKGILQVSLKDNGIGFRKSLLNSDSVHLGLIGLKDRIESIGGSFNINSELGVGTALRFSVALNQTQTKS